MWDAQGRKEGEEKRGHGGLSKRHGTAGFDALETLGEVPLNR